VRSVRPERGGRAGKGSGRGRGGLGRLGRGQGSEASPCLLEVNDPFDGLGDDALDVLGPEVVEDLRVFFWKKEEKKSDEREKLKNNREKAKKVLKRVKVETFLTPSVASTTRSPSLVSIS